MLQFYIPEVKGVEQVKNYQVCFFLIWNFFYQVFQKFKVKGAEDEVAEKEFQEFEKKNKTNFCEIRKNLFKNFHPFFFSFCM